MIFKIAKDFNNFAKSGNSVGCTTAKVAFTMMRFTQYASSFH